MIETHEQEGELKRPMIQLFVAPCGRIRCFKRNLREQRLRRAQRCGEAATGSRANFINTGWVSPRVIPGSPQSLSELLSNMPYKLSLRHSRFGIGKNKNTNVGGTSPHASGKRNP